MLNENQEEALKACVGKPQLFMPAGDDSPDVYPGGIAEKVCLHCRDLLGLLSLIHSSMHVQVLGDKANFVEFKDMNHGWTTRGDIGKPEVEAAVRRAMAEAANFFENHLKV
jgi:hypothetical protein